MLGVARTIAEASPRRAETFLEDLYDRCNRLGGMPKAFPLVPGHEESGIRRVVHGNYLIFYRIDLVGLIVLRVIHCARDYERLLFPES